MKYEDKFQGLESKRPPNVQFNFIQIQLTEMIGPTPYILCWEVDGKRNQVLVHMIQQLEFVKSNSNTEMSHQHNPSGLNNHNRQFISIVQTVWRQNEGIRGQ